MFLCLLDRQRHLWQSVASLHEVYLPFKPPRKVNLEHLFSDLIQEQHCRLFLFYKGNQLLVCSLLVCILRHYRHLCLLHCDAVLVLNGKLHRLVGHGDPIDKHLGILWNHGNLSGLGYHLLLDQLRIKKLHNSGIAFFGSSKNVP